MNSAPRISFLLPVHNHVKTVGVAIDSILAQTFADFEVVVIDDASTDGTEKILRDYKDARIHLHRNAVNRELTASLNIGLAIARGEFVARIDADDLCLATRAATQLAFMEDQPDVAVVGSFIETISESGESIGIVKYPTAPEMVAAAFLFRNPLAHPAVMFRRKLFTSHGMRYDESCRRGQDFELWVRCVLAGFKLANVPEVLTRYRVHATQVSQRETGGVRETGAKIRHRLLEAMGIEPSEIQCTMHERLAWDELVGDAGWLTEAAMWLETLHQANQASDLFNVDALGQTLCGRWVSVIRFAHARGIALQTADSPLARYAKPGVLPV